MAIREVNLIPAEILGRKYRNRHLMLWAGCFLLSLSLIFGFYSYQIHVVLPGKRPLTTVEDMQKQLGVAIEEIKATQQKIQQLSLQEAFLKKLTKIQPFSKLLLKFSEIMNDQTWLTKLIINAGAEEEEILPGIEIYGLSSSNEMLGNFLTRLAGEPMFQNVVLKYAEESRIARSPQDRKGVAKVIRFKIDCGIPRS
jgi:Tfp pilus assembly protein PilN